MLTINVILCPVDFSDASTAALHYAAEFARNSNAEIVLVHAVPTSAYLVSYDAYTVPITNFSEVKAESEKEMDIIERSLKTEVESLKITKEVVEGNPADVILGRAREHKANLIVMGSHGRKGLRRLLLGSVAEIVLREAVCPVIVIKIDPKSEIV